MTELFASLVRFSATLTAFTWKQSVDAITMPAEALRGLGRLQEALSSAATALSPKPTEPVPAPLVAAAAPEPPPAPRPAAPKTSKPAAKAQPRKGK